MEKLDFALSLIRSPFLKRVSDRTFLQSVGSAATALGGVIAIWRTQGVPVDQKVNVTMAAFGAVATVISVWNASEKRKDTEIAKAVLAGGMPDTLNAGTLVTTPSFGEMARTGIVEVGERALDRQFGSQGNELPRPEAENAVGSE